MPEETIRRRYVADLRNFFELYQPLATTWRMYDNSSESGPKLVARGRGSLVTVVKDQGTWARIERSGKKDG